MQDLEAACKAVKHDGVWLDGKAIELGLVDDKGKPKSGYDSSLEAWRQIDLMRFHAGAGPDPNAARPYPEVPASNPS
jgi:hypothetical protein